MRSNALPVGSADGTTRKQPMNHSALTIVGNLTKDPELRYTTGGRGVASFGVAVNHRYMKNGDWEESVSFFNVTAWSDLGENVAASMEKGQRVIVTGRLSQRSYETREGEKRNTVELIADEIGAAMRFAQVQVERTERTTSRPAQQPDEGSSAEPF